MLIYFLSGINCDDESNRSVDISKTEAIRRGVIAADAVAADDKVFVRDQHRPIIPDADNGDGVRSCCGPVGNHERRSERLAADGEKE